MGAGNLVARGGVWQQGDTYQDKNLEAERLTLRALREYHRWCGFSERHHPLLQSCHNKRHCWSGWGDSGLLADLSARYFHASFKNFQQCSVVWIDGTILPKYSFIATSTTDRLYRRDAPFRLRIS